MNTSVLAKLYILLWFAPCQNKAVLFGTLIFKRTSINWSQCKDQPARSVPRIGQLLIVTTWIFSAFQPLALAIVEYFSNCAHALFEIINNTFSFPESIIDLKTRFLTHSMFTRHVSKKFTIYSLCTYKFFYALFCSEYYNFLQWPSNDCHIFVLFQQF